MTNKTISEVCDLAAIGAASILSRTCELNGYRVSESYLPALYYLMERSLAVDLDTGGRDLSPGAYLLVISGLAEELGLALIKKDAADDATEAESETDPPGQLHIFGVHGLTPAEVHQAIKATAGNRCGIQ